MAFPIHLRLLASRFVCLVTIIISLSIYSSNASSGHIYVRAFILMSTALTIHGTACALQLLCESIVVWCGSTAPVPVSLPLCVLVILGDWLLVLSTVGTACMSLGVLTFFMENDIFVTSVNVRAMFHCVLSLAAGASGAVGAFLSSEIAKARHRQAQH